MALTKQEGLLRQSFITDTEAPMNRCCSQHPFGRWKFAIVHKTQWVQKFRERDRDCRKLWFYSAQIRTCLYIIFILFFLAIDYLWRPSRWSLNCTYKYMEKTPIQRNRTPNHYHATLLSPYQLICREEWQCDFEINGCCLALSVEGTYTHVRFRHWPNYTGINRFSKMKILTYQIVSWHTVIGPMSFLNLLAPEFYI